MAAGLAAAAVLALFGVETILVGQSGGETDHAANTPPVSTTTATPPSTLAHLKPGTLPRILLDAPGWTISYIDHSEGATSAGKYATSDMRFSDRSYEAELRMASGWHADFEALVADRMNSGDRLEDASVWDTTAVVIRNGGSGFIAIWESNAVEYEFLVHDTDEATFRTLLGSLRQPDEAEWTRFLSDEIVTDRVGAISSYLSDVPLPPNFDRASLTEGPVEHWYQVAGEVISAVSCGWIESWIDARVIGDPAAELRAVEAMASSRDWQVLEDMGKEGDYPSAVWEYADAMSGDGLVAAGDPEYATVEASYQRAFGCSD